MRVAVEDWELYNNGILACEWFDLEDVEIEEIEKHFKELKKEEGLNSDDLELFVADVEGDETGTIKGDESLHEAYEVYEIISGLNETEIKKINFLINCQGYKLEDAASKLDDCEIYEDTNIDSLAEEFIEEGLFGEALQQVFKTNWSYVDIKAISRDLAFDYTEYNGDICRCD